MIEYKNYILACILSTACLSCMQKDLETIYYVDAYLTKLEKSQIIISFIEALLFNTLIFNNAHVNFKDFCEPQKQHSLTLEQVNNYLQKIACKGLIECSDGIYLSARYCSKSFDLSLDNFTKAINSATFIDLHCIAIKRLLLHLKFYDFLKGTKNERAGCIKIYKALFTDIQSQGKPFRNFKQFLTIAEQCSANLKKFFDYLLSGNFEKAKKMNNRSFMLFSESINEWISPEKDVLPAQQHKTTFLTQLISKRFQILPQVMNILGYKASLPIKEPQKTLISSSAVVNGNNK